MHQARFNFMREARIWYSRDPNQEVLPGGFENEIILSDEFFREITTHSIATDLEAAKALSSSPGPWICLCGFLIDASLPKGKSAYRSWAISVWRVS
jgi:hypothetical protein